MNILIFISFFIKNLVNLQKIYKYNLDNGFYCKGKLYNPFIKLEESDLYDICKILKKDKHLVISIKKSLNLIGMSDKSKEAHEKDTQKMFEDICYDFEGMCENGIIIGIYTLDREVIIHASEKIKNNVSVNKINLVKMNIFRSALSSEFKVAIKTASELLRNFNKKSNTNIENNKRNDTAKINEMGHLSSILIKILFMIVVVGLVLLIAVCIIPNSAISNKPSFYNYTGFLINIIQECKSSINEKIDCQECLICLKTLKNDFNDNNVTNEDLYVFDCKHVYHKLCQEEMRELKCIFCNENNLNKQYYSNENFVSEITETQILKFVGNLQSIFSKDEINDFYEKNLDISKIFDTLLKISKEDILLNKDEHRNGNLEKKEKTN